MTLRDARPISLLELCETAVSRSSRWAAEWAGSRPSASLVRAAGVAGVLLAACGGTTGEATGETTQAATSSVGLLHSHVTKSTWKAEVGQNHGGWDDPNSCHPAPLAICPLFDADFIGVDAGAGCAHVTTPACPDRVDTWDNAIVFDFAIAITSDCRFGQWAPPLLTDTDVANYLNDLLAFTLQFFGCPEQGTTGRLTYGLIPSALQSHAFTTADLDALADAYGAAVAQALSDNGSPPLSAAQTKSLDAKLTRLAHRVPGRVKSNAFTFSTCAADAGPAPIDTVSEAEDTTCQ
jgi:hypothetical protein